MGSFEFMDHTADVGIVATGRDLREAFAQAATGLFDFMADLSCVLETEEREVAVTAPDRDALLVAWLNELLFICEVEHRYFRHFDIYEINDTWLKARCLRRGVRPSQAQAQVRREVGHVPHAER